jgi:integrase
VEQADALLAADDEARRRSLMAPLLAVLLATGARISEALGLTWSDVRLDASPTVTIRRETTKTDAGARVIAIEDEHAGLLRQHLSGERQAQRSCQP